DAAHGREGGVGGDVVHAYAQPAGATVQVERAGLEHGGPHLRVEVREVDEVAQQGSQVPGEKGEALHVADCGDPRGEGPVRAEEVREGPPARTREDGADPL